MITQLQPRTQAMRQHARPVRASSCARLLQKRKHVPQLNIRSRSSTLPPGSQPAQRLRKASLPAHQTS